MEPGDLLERAMHLVLRSALGIMLAATSAFAAGDDVRAVRRGNVVVLSNPARVGDKIAADLASCSVNSTRMRPAPGAWEAALASGSYLHAVYSPPRDIALFTEGNQRREMHRVDEILMPLPEGRWARDNLAKIGGKAAAFTKCDPLRLAEIIGEAELGLRDVQPYKSLMDAMQKPAR